MSKQAALFIAAAVVAAAVVSLPRDAGACSVTREYIAPSNYELIADSQTIVLARASSTVTAGTADGYPGIKHEVVEVLKGTGLAKGDSIVTSGTTDRYRGRGKQSDFSRARPGAYAGSCIAYDYALGEHYLLLLELQDGHWVVSGPPFTRANEEVDASGDPWVAAVRAYVRVAALKAPAARRKQLRKLQKRGEAKKASPAHALLAGDIASHFGHASPHKSFDELEPMYDRAKGRDKNRVLVAIGTGADPAAAEFMRQLIADTRAGNSPVDDDVAALAIAKYFEKLPDAAAVESIARLYIDRGSSKQASRWPLMWTLIRTAGPRHQALMIEAYESANDEEAGRLAEWFAKHPSPRALELMWKRFDAHYKDKYETALALAGMGDKAVVDWARKRLRKGKDQDGLADRWIAVYIIGRSPLPAADKLAKKIIKAGGKDLVALIQAYIDASHALADRRLKQIARKRGVGTDAREWLGRARRQRASAAKP